MEDFEVSTNYEPIPSTELFSQLITVENDRNMKDDEKIYSYAKAIAGFELTLEEGLYNIENRIKNRKINKHGERIVSIQTLPHHTGHDHELISPLQPATWVTDGPYGFFNPIEGKICKNCVGYFNGEAHSIFQYLWQNFTSPCFLGFHFVVILSFIFALFTKYVKREYFILHPDVQILSIKVLIIVPLVYDLLAFLFIALKEILPFGGQDTFEASLVQHHALNFIRSELVDLNSQISPKIRELLLSTIDVKCGRLGDCQCSGQFIIRYFYEPAISSLAKELRAVGGTFSPNSVTRLNWPQIEALLIVYRFLREISDSITMTNSDVSAVYLQDAQRLLIRRVFISSITKGNEECFKQLFRLLKNACVQPAKRAQIIENDHRNLSLNHYIGSAAVDLIKKDLEKEAIKLKKIADKTGESARFDAILDVLNENNSF